MKKKHYAVVRGFRPGIYNSWYGPGGAEEQVRGYANALFKGFGSWEEAELWRQKASPAMTAKKDVADKPLCPGRAQRSMKIPPYPPLVKGGWGGFSYKPVARAVKRPGSGSADTKTVPDIGLLAPSSGKTASSQRTIIYTDGGCKRNPGPGGYGAVVMNGSSRRELAQGFRLTTNNRMELMACIAALQSLTNSTAVVLHSDSQYVVNGIEKGWAKKWRAKGWMRTKEDAAVNADLWARLLELCDRHCVQFVWVRGHVGTVENERCDKLATQAALGRGLLEDTGYLVQRARPAE